MFFANKQKKTLKKKTIHCFIYHIDRHSSCDLFVMGYFVFIYYQALGISMYSERNILYAD